MNPSRPAPGARLVVDEHRGGAAPAGHCERLAQGYDVPTPELVAEAIDADEG